MPQRTIGLAISFLIFSSPVIGPRLLGVAPSWPVLTVFFFLTLLMLTLTWGPSGRSRTPALSTNRPAGFVAGAAAFAVLAYGMYELVRVVLSIPIDARRSDMLVVIRAAIDRLAHGGNPYPALASGSGVMPYGPVLWAPYVIPRAFHLDLRLVTLLGQLLIPAWCGVASVIEASRRRYGAAGLWWLLTAVMVLNPDLSRFSAVGHTPSYWPLLLPFAVLVAGEHWTGAAAVLGVLLVGRSTMVAVVPVFFLAVRIRARGEWLKSAIVCGLVVAVLAGPFLVWSPSALWENMVASYPRVMKQVVWPSADQGVIHTIGVTGWLLSHQLAGFVELAQECALLLVWAASWVALRRGRAPLPWMALALLVFSMTSLWPVYYIYFDVLLLFASAALADVWRPVTPGRGVIAWTASLAGIAICLAVTLVLSASSYPTVETAEIDGSTARVQLPRRSRVPADIFVTGDISGPAQVAATLNGTVVAPTQVGSGRWSLLLRVPPSAWIIGSNELIVDVTPAILAAPRVSVVRPQ